MSTIGTLIQLGLFLIIIGGIIYGVLLGNKVLDKSLTLVPPSSLYLFLATF